MTGVASVATGDPVAELRGMGVETGIDLGRLVAVVRDVESVLGRPLGSRALQARDLDQRG